MEYNSHACVVNQTELCLQLFHFYSMPHYEFDLKVLKELLMEISCHHSYVNSNYVQLLALADA